MLSQIVFYLLTKLLRSGCRGKTLQWMVEFQRGLLKGAMEKDGLSAVKAGALFCEAITIAETGSCQKLLDRLTQAFVF